jgi:hypothetical protein
VEINTAMGKMHSSRTNAARCCLAIAGQCRRRGTAADVFERDILDLAIMILSKSLNDGFTMVFSVVPALPQPR